MNYITIESLPIRNKKVLIRVDFNVPMTQNGEISDDSRIRASLPTIQYALDQNVAVILMSHLGRPKGVDPKLSLKPIQKRLSELLNRPVGFASDCVGPIAEKASQALTPGSILLLENLRFHPAEEAPSIDPSFAQKLSSLADFYVDDAFGAAHRKHASITEILPFFPNRAALGLLIQKELSFLNPLIQNPQRPLFIIIGGSKISTKIDLLKTLSKQADALFIGGGMSYTLLKAQNKKIGESLCEEAWIPKALELLKTSKAKIYLPIDSVIGNSFSPDAQTKVVTTEAGIPEGWRGMDIGPATTKEWAHELKRAHTIFWNGPLGVSEWPSFAHGTEAIADAIVHMPSINSIAGGGDTLAILEKLRLTSRFSHVSTGGGASLEFLETGHLPGIDPFIRP